MNFEENILKSLPKQDAEELLNKLNGDSVNAVLLNTRFISDDEFLKLYPDVVPHPIVNHAYIYDKNKYPLGKTIYHELGYFYLQEPSAMVVSSLINFNENDLVLDMCAAPGGKTIQSAFKIASKGLIIANDIARDRSCLISNNVERLGISNVLITNNDYSIIYKNYICKFDKIILDAPCSGSGMFRKDDRMILDWSYNKVLKFAQTQKNLISIAYEMLKPGGLLSYSTCSYSIEENEEVIEYLLKNTDAKIVKLNVGYSNPIKPLGIRFMPSKFNGEGQYICQIIKPGVSSTNNYLKNKNNYSFLPKCCAKSSIAKYNDAYFKTDYPIALPEISIIRYGVKIGEYTKNILHYDLHFARTLTHNDFPSIELSLEEVISYIQGNVIDHTSNLKGDVLLTYKNNPVDISRTDGLIIKNHYPKGLRKKCIY